MKIPIEARMVCPHCRVAFKSEWEQFDLGQDADGHWVLRRTQCANCERFVVNLRHLVQHPAEPGAAPVLRGLMLKDERTVWPPTTARMPIPEKVPESLAKDYRAACRVLADSAEASAALGRRCLQHLLVENAGAKKKDLADQIDEVLTSKELPARLGSDLHAVRVIGNFGAHPIKSKSTGEIVEVELGEAEWNLDVLEGLFQHYYVDEARSQERRALMNAKLKDAGKPLLP